VTTSQEQLAEATDVHDLARRLGALCLDHEPEIARERHNNPALVQLITHVEELTLAVPPSLWQPGHHGAGSLHPALTPDLSESLDLLSATPHVGCLALLRGLCVAVLVEWFDETYGIIELDRGSPFPLPVRPVHKARTDTTAYFTTTRFGQLLADFGFGVYTGSIGTVRMTFEARHSLDEACWIIQPPSFPTVATIHPLADEEMKVPPDDVNDDWWFGTGPTPDAGARTDILGQLRAAVAGAHDGAPCQIALLPELSLPEPSALQSAVAEHWEELPALIVMGSAHVGNDPDVSEMRRANESCVYLLGAELFRHEKRHPFQTKAFTDGVKLLPEGLTPPGPLTIAAGTATHLGVVVCSDAMDNQITAVLNELGVNLLLVPALSPTPGSFNLALSGIASASQGIAVIANGTPPPPRDDPLFMVLASVPHTHVAAQTREFFLPAGGSRRAVGLFDPNVALADAMSWLDG
jgi:hypothetical protein